MDASRESDPVITQLKKAIADTEAQLERYRSALSVLEKGVSNQATVKRPNNRPLPVFHNEVRQRGAMIGAANAVLVEHGKALHIDQIVRRMFDGGYRHPRPENVKGSLVRTLNRSWRSGGPFVRVGPSTYALRSWGAQ